MGETAVRGPIPGPALRGEEILRSIADEAGREADQLLEEADRQAEALIVAARRSLDARVAAVVAVAEAEVRAEAARTVNEARLRVVHRRAELSVRRLDRVIDAASRRLETIASGAEPDRWLGALERLAREGLEIAGCGAVAETRAEDVAPLRRALAARGGATPKVEVGGEVPGVRVRSADGRLEVDATLPIRLDRARQALGDRIAVALGVDE